MIFLLCIFIIFFKLIADICFFRFEHFHILPKIQVFLIPAQTPPATAVPRVPFAILLSKVCDMRKFKKNKVAAINKNTVLTLVVILYLLVLFCFCEIKKKKEEKKSITHSINGKKPNCNKHQ